MLIPGLIDRGDRVVFSGVEGGDSKSLLWQLALQFSAGIHPWLLSDFEPVSVLLIEPGGDLTAFCQFLTPLISQVQKHFRGGADRGPVSPVRLHSQGRSYNLAESCGQGNFEHQIINTGAKMVIVGPFDRIYDHAGGTDAQVEVFHFLDRMALEYKCAIVLHVDNNMPPGAPAVPAAKIAVLPLWARWADWGFNVSIAPTSQSALRLTAWRMRYQEKRGWPSMLRSDSVWPWADADSQHYTRQATA